MRNSLLHKTRAVCLAWAPFSPAEILATHSFGYWRSLTEANNKTPNMSRYLIQISRTNTRTNIDRAGKLLKGARVLKLQLFACQADSSSLFPFRGSQIEAS